MTENQTPTVNVLSIIEDVLGADEQEAFAIRELFRNRVELDDLDEVAQKALADDGTIEDAEQAVRAELDDYKLTNGDLSELENRRHRFVFGPVDSMIDAAKEYVDQMIDDGAIDSDTIINSWTRGQSREDWVEEAVSVDGYAHFLAGWDGETDEFIEPSSGQLWAVIRAD